MLAMQLVKAKEMDNKPIEQGQDLQLWGKEDLEVVFHCLLLLLIKYL